MTGDASLLRRYAEEDSEQAFGELVTRYINLVYSAAARQLGGDIQLAEDVAQTVFTALAQKAGSLPKNVLLGGWLYRHTSFVASQAMRTERRRQARERRAAEMNALNDHCEPNWEHLAPVLDQAMARMGTTDRNAIVLRYFERRDFRDVGTALAVSEEAARKRVTRALEKLRTFFTHRGLTLPATTLATVLAGHAVTAAPAGLAVSVTSAALAGAATSTGMTFTLLKVMTMTKFKVGVVSAIIVAGVATPLVLEHRSQTKLGAENRSLRLQLVQVEQENQRLSSLPAQANADQPLADEQFRELLKLRGEVGLLRNQTKELEQLRASLVKTAPKERQEPATQTDFPRESWAFAGYAEPHSAIESMFWSMDKREHGTAMASFTPGQRAKMERRLRGKSETEIATEMARDVQHTKRFQIVDQQVISDNEIIFRIQLEGGRTADTFLENARMVKVGSDWKFDGWVKN